MHVITRKHLQEAGQRFGIAAQKELSAWYKIVQHAHWHSFLEVRQVFADADRVGDYVIFNICGNRYRLVTYIHYARKVESRMIDGTIYVRSVLTHKEYDAPKNWEKGVR